MKKWMISVLVLAASAFAVGSVDAKQSSIAGAWTFTVEHLGLKLVLDQQKSTVSGTLDWPHGDPVKLTGVFVDDTLIVSGTSIGEGGNFSVHIDATGVRKPDGTLSGTLKAHFDEFNDAHQIVRTRNQDIAWTAVRGLHNLSHFQR